MEMIKLYHSKIGNCWFAVALENSEVVATAFSTSRKKVLENILKNLPYNVPFKLEEKLNPTSENVLKALKDIFDGKCVKQSFELAAKYLSPYGRRVLEALKLVPAGYVTTYGNLAKVCGGSPRAVGRVMASNPFVLLVPCHRVVRSDMNLGGFGYGVKIKWEILKREDRSYEKSSKVKVFGKDLILYPVKYVKSPMQG
ncbi:hypothetical protein DRO54_09030 [Candidatus Bathyarchaeota archaeon]|nr:MAG: hypothetical protein DRO54_09030 [Candidatus Bathyarchaeota archaeon]